ncbi:MAG: asparaginase domain-containing protein [Bacteroidota bacterium]
MHLVFIQTGGTIDKDYPQTTQGWAFEFGEPATLRMLAKLDPSFTYQVVTACQKDSTEITDEDRDAMWQCMQDHPAEGYLITHGTDTLIETAQYLAARADKQKVVVTGAMRPERFTNSDAPINWGMALGAVQTAPPGVYVAMHGVVKKAADIRRDLETGKFY